MDILLLEPYFTGSHAAWAQGYRAHSRHTIHLLTLPGRFWKWRMHGGAVTLARQFLDSGLEPDLILATDMLDLTTFLALTRVRTAGVPTAIYFHENQLTYPWSPTDRDVAAGRNKHYGFLNFSSALAADRLFFNSTYHRDSFLAELPHFLNHFPDYKELDSVETLRRKSAVLPLGLDLARFDAARPAQAWAGPPLLLWNHRWEYDKNPAEFFQAAALLAARGFDFGLVVLGRNFRQEPAEFLEAREGLAGRIVHFGFAGEFTAYSRWLWLADLLPVTSHQDFFGASVVEAIYCQTQPLLPRRLSYPELIPAGDHDRCLYDSFDELVARLETALANVEAVRSFSLRPAVARFDWREMAPHYDRALANLAGKQKDE